MAGVALHSSLTVIFIKEGESIIAYCPALDLSTCGDSFEEAKKNFEEAQVLFMNECIQRKTLPDALDSLGWNLDKDRGDWTPPEVIGQIEIPILNMHKTWAD